MTGSSEGTLAEWVTRAAKGEEAAFRTLYVRCRIKVARVAQAFSTLDSGEVEDVVQESFARAFRALPRLSHPDAFEAWLLTIARNRARSLLESRARRRSGAEELAREPRAEAVPAVPPALQLEREIAIVRTFIEQLPEGPEKETVRLFYVEGELSAREIAERLGVGKSAVTMRLERFRARVKQELLRRLLLSQWE